MGKLMIERWQCDRCKRVDDRWLKPGTAYAIHATVDFGTAGGDEINWRELCVDCSKAVSAEIAAMKETALNARNALPPLAQQDER